MITYILEKTDWGFYQDGTGINLHVAICDASVEFALGKRPARIAVLATSNKPREKGWRKVTFRPRRKPYSVYLGRKGFAMHGGLQNVIRSAGLVTKDGDAFFVKIEEVE